MAANLALKYAAERNKRLRPDGTGQYGNVRAKEYADLGVDPWVDYEALANEDPCLKDGDKVKILIVGGGHSGLLYAHRLINAGFKSADIRIIDTAGGFGGTWYWNRYPGLMCDVESYCYMPLLEEMDYMPMYRYAPGLEIRKHAERIAARNNLKALFSTKAESQEWDETKGEWVVKLVRNLGPNRGTSNLTVHAQFVFGAGGIFPTPQVPILPGFDEFRRQKHVFHTSRWDYTYTGGSQENPALVNLKDKVVGIIGTGATSVQVVPAVAKWAKHLYVFQRTPSYCGPRGNRKTDPEDWATIASKKGWQYERQRNFNSYLSNEPEPVDMVNDGWTEQRCLSGLVGNPKIITPDNVEKHIEDLFQLDIPRAEKVRARVDEVVKDAATAEKLKPWYPGWCKRPTFHDDYLEAFNLPNVTLVDTDGKGIEGYTQDGIVANGTEYNLDTLILGTGFTVKLAGASPGARMDTKIIGRDGRELQDKWSGTDYGSLFGVATNQFPNLFFNGFSGTATSLNLTSSFDINAKLAAAILSEAARSSGNSEKLIVEVAKSSEDWYTAEVMKRALGMSILATCTPGYFSEEGAAAKVKSPEELERLGKFSFWGCGPIDFEKMIADYKSAGLLRGIEIRT